MQKQLYGSGLFITSVGFYLTSLSTAIALICCVQQKYVNNIQSVALNNLITVSATIAVLAFAVAIATMIGVNVIIAEKKTQQQVQDSSRDENYHHSEMGSCFSDLLLWWLCCGPREINICSNNVSNGSESCGFLIVFVAIFASAACIFGYLVYAFNTFKRLCSAKDDEPDQASGGQSSSSAPPTYDQSQTSAASVIPETCGQWSQCGQLQSEYSTSL